MQIKSNEKNTGAASYKKFLVKVGPKNVPGNVFSEVFVRTARISGFRTQRYRGAYVVDDRAN